MVLPALGALAVKFAPEAIALAGSLAAPILSSLFGAKNEQQARDAVAPQYSAMMQRLMSQGMGKVEATRAAEEALLPEIAKAKEEGSLPGWAEGLLSVAGGVGGFALGKKLLAKGAAKALVPEAEAVAKKTGIRGRDPFKRAEELPTPQALGEQGPLPKAPPAPDMAPPIATGEYDAAPMNAFPPRAKEPQSIESLMRMHPEAF